MFMIIMRMMMASISVNDDHQDNDCEVIRKCLHQLLTRSQFCCHQSCRLLRNIITMHNALILCCGVINNSCRAYIAPQINWPPRGLWRAFLVARCWSLTSVMHLSSLCPFWISPIGCQRTRKTLTCPRKALWGSRANTMWNSQVTCGGPF